MAESIGALSKLSVNGTKLWFVKFINQSVNQLVDPGQESMCGILDHHEELVTYGIKSYRYTIVCQPTPEEVDVLLPLIGLSQSPTDTFTYTDTLTAFSTVVDMTAEVHTYANSYVDKAVVRGQVGRSPWTWELHCIAKTESLGATFSDSAPASITAPYAFNQGVLTLGGTAYKFDRFALSIDNNLATSFNNSATANDIQPTNRNTVLAVTGPYDADTSALYATDSGSGREAGYAGSLAFTRTGIQTTFTFANLKTESRPPSILSRGPIKYDQYYTAYKSGSTAALIVTHDATT